MATAKLVMDGDDQLLILSDEFRLEGTGVSRDEKTGGVILRPMPTRPIDLEKDDPVR
jgi:hypothetical protein